MSSSKASEHDTSSATPAQDTETATSQIAVADTSYTAGASHQHSASSNRHTHKSKPKHKHSHHNGSKHYQNQSTQTEPRDAIPGPTSEPSASVENDLTTWTRLTVSHSGASLRTICTPDCEDGRPCELHAGRKGSRYADIPRVDEPGVRLEVEAVRKLMEGSDEEDEGGDEGEKEEGWVVVG